MPYDSRAVANHFLKLAKEQDQVLTPMQLQKLVYFANGWHLALTNEPLIDEAIQAWKFGPVIDSLYHEFSGFGNRPIKRLASDLRTDQDTGEVVEFEPSLDEEPAGRGLDVAKAIIKRVFLLYGSFSGIQLSTMTHREGTPWQTVHLNHKKLPKRATIPNDIIKAYFRAKLDEQAKRQTPA